VSARSRRYKPIRPLFAWREKLSSERRWRALDDSLRQMQAAIARDPFGGINARLAAAMPTTGIL